MKQSGNTVKDYIAPPGFDLRYPSRFKCGRMYGSAYYLNLIAPVLTDEIIKRLLDVDENPWAMRMQDTHQKRMIR